MRTEHSVQISKSSSEEYSKPITKDHLIVYELQEPLNLQYGLCSEASSAYDTRASGPVRDYTYIFLGRVTLLGITARSELRVISVLNVQNESYFMVQQ